LRARSFTLDGEAVVCSPDGVAVFDALHRPAPRQYAMLYAFDLLGVDNADLQPLPLLDRKAKLARLLARKPAGMSTPTRMAPRCSGTPANSASKASCRSD
jgi:ATP-dependent DNA ligase